MKLSALVKISALGLRELVLKEHRPLIGSVIVTDRCNLNCRHCSVNNIVAKDYSYKQIKSDMEMLYHKGALILFLYGGEPFIWRDQDYQIRDLVILAKEIGFPIVNIVTNGTCPIDVPEADVILVSIDGDRRRHNLIRGNIFDTVMINVDEAPTKNIIFYMAINQLNKNLIKDVGEMTKEHDNVIGVAFNFHTPYPGSEALSLTKEDKQECCAEIVGLMDARIPVLNLKSAFPYLIDNTFPIPCHQCAVMENGKLWTCGRCIDEPGLCEQCGYFFAAEFALVFDFKVKVIIDMLITYLKYL